MGTAAVVTAVVGAVYGGHQAKETREETERQAKAQTRLAEQQFAADKEARDQAGAQADRAGAQQRRRTQGTVARQDTILTSPMGDTGSNPGSRKTLLGL